MTAGMPSEQEIQEWIARYGYVHHLFHNEQVYFFRRLVRREYRLIIKIEEECERSEEVCETTILWPTGFKIDMEGPAGLPEVLCSEILRASGFLSMVDTMAFHSDDIQSNLDSQMEAIIDHVFGGQGNFARYQDWSYDQLCDAFAKAQFVFEKILGGKLGLVAPEAAPPQKRGLGNKEIFDRVDVKRAHEVAKAIDEQFSGDRMATKPIGEVMKKFNRTQRMKAYRQAHKDPQIPPLK